LGRNREAQGEEAIRRGKVIADALDSVELRNKPEVDEDDFLMPVPDSGSSAFLF
jgi:hypothetical protein